MIYPHPMDAEDTKAGFADDPLMRCKLLNWTCPTCGMSQVETIDPDDGPFLTCTCEKCGGGFMQDDVTA
jgi:ribosomal protein S27AE